MRGIDELSEEELEKVINDYYDGVSVSKIIQDFNLSIVPSQLYKHFPPLEFPEYTCEYCKRSMVAKRKSKSDFSKKYYESDLYCPICKHTLLRVCDCLNCQKKTKKNIQEKQLIIRDTYKIDKNRIVPIEEISFENKVYLGALCRMLLTEDLTEIMPYSNRNGIQELTPNSEWTGEILKKLHHDKLLSVSPDSNLDAFVDGDDFPRTYYIYKVSYVLNLCESDIITLLDGKFYDSEKIENVKVALKLWRKIAVNECVNYLLYQLNKVHFDFKAGEKTFATFEQILNDFSVAQTYGIIWKAVAEASRFYQEGNISKRHAANTTISNCQRYAERAKLNSWTLTEYSRIRDLPQSELAIFLYNKVLQIGELGFTCIPSEL